MSRTRHILDLSIAGCTPRGISRELGVSTAWVYKVRSRARKQGLNLPTARSPGRRPGASIHGLDGDARAALIRAAEARDMSAYRLARLILRRVVSDGLIDAVLDDGAAHE